MQPGLSATATPFQTGGPGAPPPPPPPPPRGSAPYAAAAGRGKGANGADFPPGGPGFPSTPLQQGKGKNLAPQAMESPGNLEDFQHMGLINDILGHDFA